MLRLTTQHHGNQQNITNHSHSESLDSCGFKPISGAHTCADLVCLRAFNPWIPKEPTPGLHFLTPFKLLPEAWQIYYQRPDWFSLPTSQTQPSCCEWNQPSPFPPKDKFKYQIYSHDRCPQILFLIKYLKYNNIYFQFLFSIGMKGFFPSPPE